MYHGWNVWSVACCRNRWGGKGRIRAVVFAFVLEAMHNLHRAVVGGEQDTQCTYNVTLRRVPAVIVAV